MIFNIDNYVYDPVIEKKPVFTHHAQQRKDEGRSGSFIYVRSGNSYKIITILPTNTENNRKIPTISNSRRKNKLKKYKYRG